MSTQIKLDETSAAKFGFDTLTVLEENTMNTRINWIEVKNVVLVILSVALAYMGGQMLDTQTIEASLQVKTSMHGAYVHCHNVEAIADTETITQIGWTWGTDSTNTLVKIPCTVRTHGQDVKVWMNGHGYTATCDHIDTDEGWMDVSELAPIK